MTHSRKAVVSENGRYITVMKNGKEYSVYPAVNLRGDVRWLVQCPLGKTFLASDIWAAIEAHEEGDAR